MKAQRTIRRKSFLGLGFLVLWIAGLSAGCGNEGSGFFPGADDFRFGAISVRVFDQQGPVAGVTLELRDRRGNLLWEDLNKTGAEGGADFTALTPGFYTITIRPPGEYFVPASQPNPIGVEVLNAQFSTVRVLLVRL
jgi:hypothetical protein